MNKCSVFFVIALMAAVWALSAGPECRPAPATAAGWNELGPAGGDIRGIAVNPGSSRQLFAVTNNGQLFKSDNAGTLWTRTDCLEDDLYDIAYSPSRPAVLYVLGTEALFRSEDGGGTWTRRSYPSGAHGDGGRLAVHPRAPDTVFVAGYIRSGTSKWMAVFQTSNGGKSWAAAKLAATSHNGTSTCVVFDPLQPSTVFVGGSYNDTKKKYIFKSTDSGKTWRDVTGSINSVPYEIIVDPADAAKVYVTTAGGFFQSRDGGKTWQGCGGDGFGLTMALIQTNPRTFFTSWGVSQVYRSCGGINWTEINTGFFGGSRRFAISASGIHLASTSGLIKSSNNGSTWRLNQDGIKATRIATIALTPASPSLLYAASYERGVSKSVDAGRTWETLWTLINCEFVPSLSVHPRDAKRLLIILESG